MGFDVAGKTALVTGANRGIGRTIADTLIQQGVTRLYAAVRDPDSAGGLIDAHGEKVRALPLDLSQPETITAAANTAGDCQLVVNNAGVLRTANPLSAAAIESLQFEMDVNVYGLIRIARAFAPVLKANGGGAFVQLNSVASLRSFPDFATYCASKAAAYSITQALRAYLGAQGTAVLSVHPGPISTDMADEAGFRESAEPPSLVADGIVSALRAGEFHLFPDTMAKQIGGAYADFAKSIVEANLMEG
jgi:NAD(P)-dependent dehydrogenase (short-subunit alcohol dehydrogenase family)